MIADHLLNFSTVAAAIAVRAVGQYWTPASADGPGSWRGDFCIPNVSVWAAAGTEIITDPETGQTYQRDTRQSYPGWFIVLSLPRLVPALRDLPNGACWRITDRDQAAIGGRKFVLHWSRLAEDLAAFRTEPSFAGDQVPDRMRAAPAPATTVRVRGDWSKTVLVDGAQR